MVPQIPVRLVVHLHDTRKQLLVTELLTDCQTTVNVEILGEVPMNVDDINTLYNCMKNQETVIPQA